MGEKSRSRSLEVRAPTSRAENGEEIEHFFFVLKGVERKGLAPPFHALDTMDHLQLCDFFV